MLQNTDVNNLLKGLGWPESILGLGGSVSYVPIEMTESFCNAVVRFDGLREITAQTMVIQSGRLIPFAKLTWIIESGIIKSGHFFIHDCPTTEVEAMAAYQSVMARCGDKPSIRFLNQSKN